MTTAHKPTKKPHFRNLRVEPYEPWIPGLRESDEDVVDVSRFTPIRYIVRFEYRTGWRRKWRKVEGYA